jgi:pimeloyl-ACP methyl ester carboxylesterase
MEKVISKDGTVIAYDKYGSGPAVIIVSGAFISRSHEFNAQLNEALKPHFTVFNYDRRGRGDSGDTKPYSIEREIEDIAALIKVAGGSAHVFGTSSGAALALKAATSGLNIEKLALYEPPFMLNPDDRPPADHETQLNRFVDAGQSVEATKYFMTKVMRMPAIVPLVMRFTPHWARSVAVAHTLPYDAAIMGDFSFPDNLVSSIKIPVLSIGGAKSPLSLRNSVRKVADTAPHGELRLLEGQAHYASVKVLAPALIKFFGNSN